MVDDTGWQMRADILRRDADAKLVGPLRRHSWRSEIERVEPRGEYAVISAERNGLHRKIALLYSSATDNSVYRRLEAEVDLTLFNGEPYQVDQFTRGLVRVVYPVSGFQLHLIEWNRESEPGKVAEDIGSPVPAVVGPPQIRIRRLMSESPIETVWSRLLRLKSATLARKALTDRAAVEGVVLTNEIADSKGDGVAYAIRNAADYFSLKDVSNLSQRVLTLYYGCLSFVLAEMLAAPTGPTQLEKVEDVTKQGHGFWSLDLNGGFGEFSVGPLQSGLFPTWMRATGSGAFPTVLKKPKDAADLASAPPGCWATMEQLFARIPEVGDLFEDVFTGCPAWVSPVYDPQMNMSSPLSGGIDRPQTTYITLVDDTGRMTVEDVAGLPGPLHQIRAVDSKTRARHFNAAVNHPGMPTWWGALKVHHSPFERSALILPAFGCIDDYRAICLAILYGLSIIVRYRPSLWRRVQEGDLDHMRALIEAFLLASERILPEQFLESVTGERLSIHQPGSIFS